MDGEETSLSDTQIDDHVAGCVACRSWADAAVAVNRRLRIREVVAAPDLSEPILRAAVKKPTPAAAAPRAVGLLRAALGFVGFVQLCLGLAQLLGVSRDGMNMTPAPGEDHLFNESTAWNIAVAIGLLVAVVWPRLARGFLTPLGVFVLVLSIVSIGDIVSGQVTAARLESHIFLVIGLLLLFLLDRTAPIPAPVSADTVRWTDDEVLARSVPAVSAAAPDRFHLGAGRRRRHVGLGRPGRRAA